ncbi:MAG: endopeptidase La [Planctomycetes bacterium]|nr:endopeptidase La [Planctomycetota bacterium]
MMPLVIGRAKSRKLIEDVLPDQRVIVLVAQKDASVENPTPDDLYQHGTAVVILKLLRTSEEAQTIVVHGLVRVRIEEYVQTEPYFRARITPLEEQVPEGKEIEARLIDVRQKALRIVQLSPNIPDEAQMVINSIDQPGALADFLAANLVSDVAVKQELLAETNVLKRLERLEKILYHQVEVLELSGQLQEKVRESIDKAQREYFLREQLKAIKKELGQIDEQSADIEELTKKVNESGMSESVKSECFRQIRRLETIPPASPEYSVIRTYLEVMTELPWNKYTEDNLDIRRAKRILDEDHYNLDKVKKRILEYLAVRRLAPDSHGPILCFVGPPGVGKTSLGMSIARALGRKFIRMSLGGLRDEAELRGHRRTYIGAMPGRIIQEIRKAGSANPVFMLDELDKVGMDFRGDPTSALLEILDPAQNFSFQDHYLNVPFDLSKVMFIGTANVISTISPALRDRMEIINLSGYTTLEKKHIAQRHLVPRQLKENGLSEGAIEFTDEALEYIIAHYTREAGVRELERQIGAICRAIAVKVAAKVGKSSAKKQVKKVKVEPKDVRRYLGPIIYENEVAQRTSVPGVATGLAYTAAGGEIIFIEATSYPGKGQLILTGQIGDVMKESARTALSLVMSRAGKLGIDEDRFQKIDIHIHVPAGAVPKDGPSAGVAMATSIASMMLERSVRPDVAMTGEITLRGLVLPVGAIKEKVLAAAQAGIKTVILPARNRKDITDVPSDVRKQLKLVFSKTIDDVLRNALVDSDGKVRKSKNKRQ